MTQTKVKSKTLSLNKNLFLFFDTETTGFPKTKRFQLCQYYPYTDLEKYDSSRIVQITWIEIQYHLIHYLMILKPVKLELISVPFYTYLVKIINEPFKFAVKDDFNSCSLTHITIFIKRSLSGNPLIIFDII